jgi:predicted nucleic acid-binding protein
MEGVQMHQFGFVDSSTLYKAWRPAITGSTFAWAAEVQRQLARHGPLHHRSVKIADLIIAAAAEQAGAIVWHYDEDFDRIAGITGQPVEWIARRGSL